MSRRRTISEEEEALLESAMRAVKPLRKRAAKSDRPIGPSPPARAPKKATTETLRERASPKAPAVREPARSQRQALGAIDRRTEQKLKRGRIEIDATLDLHGMTQSAAHKRLNGFLKRAAAEGHRRVLVITGKGSAREDSEAGFMPSDRRGVLREAVPRWIAEPPLVDLVWGMKPAGPRHGGQGALYVLLKRQPS